MNKFPVTDVECSSSLLVGSTSYVNDSIDSFPGDVCGKEIP